jgi:competence protein ComEA
MAPSRLVALEVLAVLSLLVAGSPSMATSKDLIGVVNLNTAAPELLGLLPGIGPAKAKGIVAYRARHPLRTVDELVRVKGIGRRMVRLLRGHLAISGPSTARLGASGASAVTQPAQSPPGSTIPPIRKPICAPPSKLPTFPSRIPARPVSPRVVYHANHCLPPR